MKPPADIMEGKASSASSVRLQNRGPGKSSLSLQELQELAEKQKQQIYLNNKELLAKQQKLLELQQYGFRNKPRFSPSVSAPEQDSYAAKLRETYQNHLERLREMQIVQDDTDAQRFSNIELSFELDRVRDMFLSKQRELASAVAKVESLTKQLEERRSGVTTWNITPEKMRRRRKIQAAREELDKLRNEMTIRNELNNQQSHQLKRQKEILREKQRELNDLDAQIHMLGKQLKHYQTKGQPDPASYKPVNGENVYRGNFSPANLYDSLQRKRIVSKPLGPLNYADQQQYLPGQAPAVTDVNGNVYDQAGTLRNGSVSRPAGLNDTLSRRKLENGSIRRGSPVPCTRRGNLYVAPDGREFDKPPTWEDFLGIEKQPDSNRVFSPPLSNLSETTSITRGSIQPPTSPNLPRGRTDVKPAVQVNGLDSPISLINGSPKTQKPAFRDSPLSGHAAKRDIFSVRLNDSLKPENSLSPSSSVSSLSSMSSSITNDDIRPNFPTAKEVRDTVPPVASYFTRPDRSSVTSPPGYTSMSKQSQDVWSDSTEFRALESSSPIPPSPLALSPVPVPQPATARQPSSTLSDSGVRSIYSDARFSSAEDTIRSRRIKFLDVRKSTAREVINYSYLHKAVDAFNNVIVPEQKGVSISGQQNGYSHVSERGAGINSVPPEATTTNKTKPQVAPKPVRQPPPPPPPTAPKPTVKTTDSTVDATVAEEKQSVKSVKNLVEKFGGQDSEPLPPPPPPVDLSSSVAHGEAPESNSNNINSVPPPPLDETDNIAAPDLVKEFPPPPPYMPKVPDHNPPPYSEIENYELSSFADIDVISATQNDLLPFLLNSSRSQYMNDSQDSTYDSDSSSQKSEEKVVVPVVISVPPEKMPPPILMWPGRERRPKRKVQLDPHALLLDASLEGELGIVKQILSKVPDPSLANAEGITALHNAVCGNHKDVVKFLVEIGCDINSADNNGWTPLHCAAFYNDTELCTYLVEHGASVYATTYSDCQTPSQKCSRLEDNYDQCFQYLHECKDHVGKQNGGRVYGLFDYMAENEDELSFTCGELLMVKRRGDGVEKDWWWAENSRGQSGYVAQNLLGLYPRVAAEV